MRHVLICITILLGYGLCHAERIPERTAEGFMVPQPNTPLSFPRSHASHPEYKIEWWYLTGHIFDEGKNRHGFQATFFRSAAPLREIKNEAGTFGGDQLYLAHMAWTDESAGTYDYEERLNRDGWDAAAATETLDLHNGNWTLRMTDSEREIMQLACTVRGEIRWELTLTPMKPRVQFGQDGTSRKGAAPEARSYYVSFTRLKAEGKLHKEGKEQAVRGEVWMDHEIASQQLDASLAGWDWTAIQLRDGREIKAYLLRKLDGTPDAYSSLIWIGKNNELTYAGTADFEWEKIGFWKSPHTGTSYPTRLVIRTIDPDDGRKVSYRLEPILDDQEFGGRLGGPTYWEGACRVFDAEGQEVGSAYLELVGYDKPVGNELR